MIVGLHIWPLWASALPAAGRGRTDGLMTLLSRLTPMCMQCVASNGVYVAGAVGALQVLRARARRSRDDGGRIEADAATTSGTDGTLTGGS